MENNKRWKPGYGEKYWFVDTNCGYDRYTWINDTIDNMLFEAGNCFRTETEAEYAATKVKELLLIIQDSNESLRNNKTPEITKGVFSSPDCPDWAKVAVVNCDGSAYWVSNDNIATNNKQGFWYSLDGPQTKWQPIEGKFDSSEWENAVVVRPAALPDWCKVGGYGYAYDSGYFKIIEIIDGGKNLKVEWVKEGVQGTVFGCNIEHKKQARLRPWIFEEIPKIPFEIKSAYSEMRAFVSMAYYNKVKIGAEVEFTSNSELAKDYLMSDGSPCGVLEHLENGEWVQ